MGLLLTPFITASEKKPKYSPLKNLYIQDLPLQAKSKPLIFDVDHMVDVIYAKYDFHFGSTFREHNQLKLLAYAKPLIQYFVDELIAALCNNKLNALSHNKIETLINAFTPMLINRLARVSDRIIESDRQIILLRSQFSGSNMSGAYEPFVKQIQSRAFVDYFHKAYPELFQTLLRVSTNWVAFVTEFSRKLNRRSITEVK